MFPRSRHVLSHRPAFLPRRAQLGWTASYFFSDRHEKTAPRIAEIRGAVAFVGCRTWTAMPWEGGA